MSSRRPIGYVVEIDGAILLINLLEDSRGHVAGHRDGLSTVEQPGDLVGVEAGAETVIVRVIVARQSGWRSATIRMTFGNRDEFIIRCWFGGGKRYVWP